MRKRVLAIAAAIPVLAFAASAQDDTAQVRTMEMRADSIAAQAKVLSVRTGVMGKIVKDAPYSATEITESNQVLADGTHIHNEAQAQVYRDSQGRTRRETPDSVTIWDPVAKVSYILNPKDQTAQQLPLGGGVFFFSQNGQNATFKMKLDRLPDSGQVTAAVPNVDKTGAEAKVFTRTIMAPGAMAGAGAAGFPPPHLEWFGKEATTGTPESLGTQNIEGVMAEGTRTTSTIPTGAIGNDRPLQIVNERWFSPDLQMVVQSSFSDPRTGEETFHLTNISRAEPAAYLFTVPAGYQIASPKQ
jgi:hypothetical protein